MKNLNLLFDLLLFPFLFVMRFVLSRGQNKHSHRGRWERGKGGAFSVLMTTLILISPLSLSASGNDSGNSCGNAMPVALDYNGASQDFVNKHYNNSKDKTIFITYYEFTPTVDGSIRIYTTGSDVNIKSKLRNDICDKNAGRVDYASDNNDNNNVDYSYASLQAGQTYKVYMRYVKNGGDFTGETHTFTPIFDFTPVVPPNTCTGTRGLTGNYYNNTTYTNPIVMSRIDGTIDFEWGNGNPGGGINNDNFSTEWTGTIYIPETASYTFALAHDDVMILTIDGNEIYNNSTWTGGANNFNDATPVALTAGTYPITVRFVEWGGGAYAKLAWRNDATITTQEIVPNINFCTTASTTSADLALSKPTPPSPLTANINEDIHFQPHLENLGPDTASANITLSITYSLDVTIGSVPTGYTCSVSSGALAANTANVCTSSTDIAASSAQDFLFTVQATEGGSLTQAVTVSSPTNDPDATNNLIISDAVTIGGFLAVTDNFSTPANTTLTENVFTNDIGIVSGVTMTNVDTSTLQGTLTSLDVNTGAFTFQPNTNFTGPTSFTYTISDGTSTSTATVHISVTNIPINAVDDSFDTYPDVTLRDNILTNDTGLGITYDSMITSPTHGSVTVQSNGDFAYTPSGGYRGDDTFEYQITDVNGNTDTATVTIHIRTLFTSGSTTPFQIVNPDYARNVIGDYKIAGNTVLCLTEKTDGYGGTCHGNTDYQLITSNMHVSKYLDIDGDGGTWNSTSSNIDLSGTAYDPTRGVIWAGLFWEGRISSNDTYYIRYYTENYPNAPTAVEVGKGGSVGSIDVSTLDTQNIKLKIDTGSYNDIIASTFHTAGQTYSAYADVTAVLQAAALNKSKHTFTVANLTTMEGREGSPGAFGAWSLVVIYAETYEFGKPRNISIYNGFVDIGQHDDPIEISGFKLPKTGDISAQLSVFSGEGEYRYGRRPGSDRADWMKISNNETSGYDYMPGKADGDGVGNKNNMFDAVLDGIDRSHKTDSNGNNLFNDLGINNVGADVDNYDVSSLMTGYRDTDENVSTVYIKTYSNQDYITVSMMAFSAELYVPKLCYDYTLDVDGYVLPSTNNEIKTPFGNFGKPLTTALYLKSLEGDIPLTNVNINYHINNTTDVTYNQCDDGRGSITYLSETGQYDYTPACDLTHDRSPSGFGMYIGTGATSLTGGTINAFEDRYIKFESDLHNADVNASFDFSVDYNVNYGSGNVPLHQIFTADDLCVPTSNGFLPKLGMFNVTDANNGSDKWNLYTQVSKRPFNLKLYAYEFDANDYLNPITTDLNLSVEVEMIRADNFDRDANTACNDEHSLLASVPSKFVNFNDGDGKSVAFGYGADEIDLAYRSVAMRIWYLTDVDGNGTLLNNHNCTRDTQPECVKLYNAQYAPEGNCNASCSLDNTSLGNCYDCLRTNYGRKVCSRDNFAIRPESFITQIYDSNQSNLTTDPSNHIANSISTASQFSVIAGYKYRFDINATNHVDDVATPRYIQHFEPGSGEHWAHMVPIPSFKNNPYCNDAEDKNISFNIFNGSDVNPITHITYLDKVDQIGEYKFEIYDQNWTSADWDSAQMLHHTTGQYTDYYDGDDCVYDSNAVLATGTTGLQGCAITSVHTNTDAGKNYLPLYARYYPYTFDVTGLTIGGGPNNDKNIVYINTLNSALYPNGIDENMSFNVQDTFFAAGYTHNKVSNFVNNCYAENVNMELLYNYNHPAPSNSLTYDLFDYNITGYTRINSALPSDNIIVQTANNFDHDMNGSINMDLGYNYTRAYNTTINPISVSMNDFNISYATAPATVYVDLVDDYKIFGDKPIDQNITFVYGRAKPGRFFYDDVTANSIRTPVSVVVYCDLGIKNCQDRGVPLLNAQTNESNWWKSVDHDNITGKDGNIALSIPANGSFTNGTVQNVSANIDTLGTDSNPITVFYKSGTKPITIPIDLVVNDPLNPPVPSNYTDRWLIYNPYSATVKPSPFYKVRFIGSSVWTGVGKTGNVVNTGISTKKSRRLDW